MYIRTYKCAACEFESATVDSPIGYYQFDDGERMPVLTSNAWCFSCLTITRVENLPPVEYLASEVKRFESGDFTEDDREHAALFDQPIEDMMATLIATFTEMIRRFKNRSTPSRCIECGGTEYNEVDDAAGMTHPECGGTFQLVDQALGSPATYFLLDTEGVRIQPPRTP